MNEKTTVLGMAAEYYRAKQLADLSINLSRLDSDIINELLRLCQKNGITIETGLKTMIDKSKNFAQLIEKTNLMTTKEIVQHIAPTNRTTKGDQPDSEHYHDIGSVAFWLFFGYSAVAVITQQPSYQNRNASANMYMPSPIRTNGSTT